MTVLEIEAIRQRLEPFLQRLLRLAQLDVKFRIEPGGAPAPSTSLPSAPLRAGRAGVETGTPDIVVNLFGPDADLLLQRGGELLGALEYVSVKFLRLSPAERLQITFDCEDYKSLRVEELRLTAETAAERVEHTGEPFALNPMNSRERRIVHLALRDNPAVRTESQGADPYRKIVIFPAEKT